MFPYQIPNTIKSFFLTHLFNKPSCISLKNLIVFSYKGDFFMIHQEGHHLGRTAKPPPPGHVGGLKPSCLEHEWPLRQHSIKERESRLTQVPLLALNTGKITGETEATAKH